MRRRMGRPGLVGTMARTAVIAGTATAVSGGVRNSQQAKASSAAQQQQAQLDAQQAAMQSQAEMAAMQQQLAAVQAQQSAAAAPASAPAGSGGIVAELEKLASLKASGILSDEEFQAAKVKLLG